MTVTLYLMLIVPIIGIAFTLSSIDKSGSSAKYHKIITTVSALEFTLCLITLFIFNKHIIYVKEPYFSINGLSILFLTASSLIFLLQNILNPKIICKSPKLYTILFLGLELLVIGTLEASDTCLFKALFLMAFVTLFALLTLFLANNKTVNRSLLFINLGICLFSLGINFYYPIAHPLVIITTYISFIITGLISPLIALQYNSTEHSNQNLIITIMTIPVILSTYGITMLCIIDFPYIHTLLAPSFCLAFCLLFLYFSVLAFWQNDLSGIITNFACATISLIFIAGAIPQIFPSGAIFLCLNYPFVLLALFATTNILSGRFQSTELSKITGLFTSMPTLAVISFITLIASISFPLTGGFIGYSILLNDTYPKDLTLTIFLSCCLIITAIYFIGTYCSTMGGRPDIKNVKLNLKDISITEGLFILICLSFSIGIGVFPDWFTEFFTFIHHYKLT